MSDTLHKREMSERVAELMGCSKARGEQVLNAVLESVTDAVREGDRMVLMGLRQVRGARDEEAKVTSHTRREQGRTHRGSGAQERAFQGGRTLRQVAAE